MLVPQELLSSVVFLGQRSGDRVQLHGTGYFVAVPGEHGLGRRHVYLVTAHHCIRGRSNLVARLNVAPDVAAGTFEVDLPDGDKWWHCDNPEPGTDYVDVAATSWP